MTKTNSCAFTPGQLVQLADSEPSEPLFPTADNEDTAWVEVRKGDVGMVVCADKDNGIFSRSGPGQFAYNVLFGDRLIFIFHHALKALNV